MDLSKLTAAPWTVTVSCVGPAWGFDVPELEEADYRDSRFGNKADAEFIALARNAFDVMMRRGWHVYRDYNGKWSVMGGERLSGQFDTGSKHAGSSYSEVFFQMQDYCNKYWSDPFTALVEADAWYAREIEGKVDSPATGGENAS